MKYRVLIGIGLSLLVGIAYASQENFIDPTVRATIDRGVNFVNNDQYAEAEKEFAKVLAADPQSFIAYNYLGLIALRKGDDAEKSLAYFRRSSELNANYLEPYINSAMVYSGLEHWDDSIKVLGVALKKNPNEPRALFYLAWVYLMGKHEPDKAVDYFLKASSAPQLQSQALYGLGVAYILSGNRPLALEVITTLRSSHQDALAARVEELMRHYNMGSSGTADALPASPKPKPKPKQPAQTSSSPKTVKTNQPSLQVSGTGTVTINTTISNPKAQNQDKAPAEATMKGTMRVPKTLQTTVTGQ